MTKTKLERIIWTSGILFAVGVVAAFAGFFSYMTRYANLDSLEGIVDDAVYEQVTHMFVQEKFFLLGGLILAIVGTIGIVFGIASRSRTAKLPS